MEACDYDQHIGLDNHHYYSNRQPGRLFGNHQRHAHRIRLPGRLSVCSMGGSSIRDGALFLLFHLLMEMHRPPDDLQVRMTGANFLRNISALIAVVAVQALIFSLIEGWAYFDAIYFAVVTMLVPTSWTASLPT
jgi:hypothetical protein